MRELVKKWPVSHVVIQNALARCSDAGLLIRCPGKRTIVSGNKSSPPAKFQHHFYLVIEGTEEEELCESSYFFRFQKGLQSGFEATGVLVSAITVMGKVQEKKFVKRLKSAPPDAVLLMRSKRPDFIRMIKGTGIPLAVVEPHFFPNESFVIAHDEKRVAEDLVAQFIMSGCNRLSLLHYDDNKWPSRQRFSVLVEAMRNSGCSVEEKWVQVTKKRDIQTVYHSLKEIFDKNDCPDGLIVSNIGGEFFSDAFKKTQIANPPKIGTYAVNPDPSVVDFAVLIDGFRFGMDIAKYFVNNFYKKEQGIVLFKNRNLTLPYTSPIKVK